MPFREPRRQRAYEVLMELSRIAAETAESVADQVEEAGKIVAACLMKGGKVLTCGNGGSAAQAQHFTAELLGRMGHERRSLAALSLTADSPVVTALANDYGYEHVFARQIEGLGREGDVLLTFSTSGRSANVLRAIEAARRRGMRAITIVGEDGDPLLDGCDVCIHVPTRNTQRVQEIHIALMHALCESMEQRMSAGVSEAESKAC